jgi:Bax protein
VILFFFTGCNQKNVKEDVKVVKKSFFTTKLGTIENQKLVTTLPEIKKPIIVKKKKNNTNSLVQEKKQRFKDILVPIVKEVYNTLQSQYLNVKKDIELGKNQEFITKLKEEYKVTTNQELLQALKPHPISITLAQAAIESAWLTSRFTIKANNIFGVWSFNSDEPRIEASSTRGERKIYLKKYKTFKAAVSDYYKNLAKSWAYEKFREQRVLTNDPYHLVQFLQSYSEKKERYTKLLGKMIEHNDFYQYDIK